MLNIHYISLRKGGRVVNCTNFENWRGFAVTEGSNPSLSVTKKLIIYRIEITVTENSRCDAPNHNNNNIKTKDYPPKLVAFCAVY